MYIYIYIYTPAIKKFIQYKIDKIYGADAAFSSYYTL